MNPYVNVQARVALREMMHNRGCFDAPKGWPDNANAQLTTDAVDQANVDKAVCSVLPDLMSQPNLSAGQREYGRELALKSGCPLN